jgi:biopolymer transport protein ExbD
MKETLVLRFAIEARIAPQPEVHIKEDKLTHCDNAPQVMSTALRTGLVKIVFVTDTTIVQ